MGFVGIPGDRDRGYSVAFTERHGMAKELCHFPPPGVEYSFLKPLPAGRRMIGSSIKGYLGRYRGEDNDLIEAILSPVLTEQRWIYSLANFQEATSFNLLGLPLPRRLRVAYIKSLLLRDNFRKLVFWSEAGKETLRSYGGVQDRRILDKSTVVYPAIREVPESQLRFSRDKVHLLFSGDFFRKGGVNVVDAFERAQRLFPNITLRLCCDEKIDFNTPNASLREEYLGKVRSNDGIVAGRISREEMINEVLPVIDIYLLPTYVEAFGFAILEAMAYGIPVISTNYFAIPEMVEHGVSGFLIDTRKFDCDALFKGYVVNEIPAQFREHVTGELFSYLCQLIESAELRGRFGAAALRIARTRFSFAERNRKMFDIYREALC
jgi:glycosyltransferase involved in cell wall biosynthesis